MTKDKLNMMAIESGLVGIVIGATSLVVTIVEIVMEERDNRMRHRDEERLSNKSNRHDEGINSASKELINTLGSGGVEKR
jgi:hypothetical protein